MPSTNSTLRDLLRSGWAGHGAAVWADEQTEGRGRLGRNWVSRPGSGLFVSVFLADVTARLTYCLAALAVRDAVRDATGADCRIKWPNDVLLAGKKVAGILIEQLPHGAIVGIGINTNMSESELVRIGPEATSIESATGLALDHATFLEQVLRRLDDQYVRSGQTPELLFQDWKAALVTLGQTVEVETTREKWLGKAVDVAIDGSLLVLNDRRLVRVYAADVRIRPK